MDNDPVSQALKETISPTLSYAWKRDGTTINAVPRRHPSVLALDGDFPAPSPPPDLCFSCLLVISPTWHELSSPRNRQNTARKKDTVVMDPNLQAREAVWRFSENVSHDHVQHPPSHVDFYRISGSQLHTENQYLIREFTVDPLTIRDKIPPSPR
ncbi:hypothetical protein C8R44DRAFT_868899 [Mycena epipterygia]|nr:hypothetical protein C8R44DRAFT_868899 [Mycena epipterygia]